VLLCITALYTLVYSGITGLLFCSAIGLIVASFVNQPELIAAAVIFFSLFYLFFLKRYLKNMEPFANPNDEIVSRIGDITSKYPHSKKVSSNSHKEPAGVYDPAIEGFQDVSPNTSKDGAPSDSSSASTAHTTNQVPSEQVKAVTSALEGKSDEEVEKEETKSATGTLFKTGQMPSENIGGPKLDAGKTIMKAMESFDSNTIGSMTDDTKKLLETQKSLMGMLTQMRPVLADGKELLQTFSGMFGGGSNGNGSGMQFKL
jgi:cytoskeletal protein RodZ